MLPALLELWERVLKTLKPNDTTYFYGFGGGGDFNATKHVHLRVDVEFVHVDLFSGLLGRLAQQLALLGWPDLELRQERNQVTRSTHCEPEASPHSARPLVYPSHGPLQRSTPMPIAHLTLELRIEGAQSLKDRRQVLRSLKDRLRSGFNVSVAEIDPTELWQSATLGVVAISSSRDYLDGLDEAG